VPTNRTPIQRIGRGLSYDQRYSLEFGDPDHLPPAFRNDDERRAAWFQHRDVIMPHWQHGHRPLAWWQYEAHGLQYPQDPAYQEAVLYERGLLGNGERASLLRQWREYFDRAQDDDFGYCVGRKSGQTFSSWLHGDEARQAHYRWAGIPRELIRRWERQRYKKKRPGEARRGAVIEESRDHLTQGERDDNHETCARLE
jgi:hypothetical protein